MVAAFTAAAEAVGGTYPPADLLNTACLLTATTIADVVRRFDPAPHELVVSGGGARNATMMAHLRRLVGGLPVLTTDDLGVPGDAKEAIAFALLGAATLDGEPSNVPAVTGARRAVVLGSVTPRPT
jgi:anhydro-N-acetylmuramic acid kinase